MIFAALLTALLSPVPTIETLRAKHVEALGGAQAIASMHTIVERGTYKEGTFEIAIYDARRRPFFRVIGDPAHALDDVHEGYDGSAWEYYPDPGIVVRTVGAAAAATRHAAPIDDPIVLGAENGVTLKVLGTSTVLGKAEYDVLATLADGFSEHLYVNPETWMIDAERRVVPMHAFGKRLNTLNVLSDYRAEGGVLRPHLFREIDEDSGTTLTQSALTRVEVNADLPESAFAPPVWNRTPLQRMIQQMYDERDESVAVLHTYADYSKFLDITTKEAGDAVDFVGYQILKMGHADVAVALLERNVADHETSARAHFGLGRALAELHRVDEAKAQYRRALQIDPTYARAKTALNALP